MAWMTPTTSIILYLYLNSSYNSLRQLQKTNILITFAAERSTIIFLWEV
jgi:hypothetical protein